jgi:hypothetical protein
MFAKALAAVDESFSSRRNAAQLRRDVRIDE